MKKQMLAIEDIDASIARFEAGLRVGVSGRYMSELVAVLNEIGTTATIMGLNGRSGPKEVLDRDLPDSLAVAYLVNRARDEGREVVRVLDLGTGSGLPGLPLALLIRDIHVDLVDRRAAARAFLEPLLSRLKIKNAVFHVKPSTTPYHLCVGRAVEGPRQLLRRFETLLGGGGLAAIMAGENWAPALEVAKRGGWAAFLEHRYSLADGTPRAAILVENVLKRG